MKLNLKALTLGAALLSSGLMALEQQIHVDIDQEVGRFSSIDDDFGFNDRDRVRRGGDFGRGEFRRGDRFDRRNNRGNRGNSIGLGVLIRQEINQRHLEGWNLKQVKVSAKSRHGQGEIALQVGRDTGYFQTVAGNPESFDSYFGGFYDIYLNPGFGAGRDAYAKRIRLQHRGNIKFDDAVVTFSKRLGYNHYEGSRNPNYRTTHIQSLRVGTAGKVRTIQINRGERLRAISIIAEPHRRGKIRNVVVSGLKIRYASGKEIIVNELVGAKARVDGRTVEFPIQGELRGRITEVEIHLSGAKVFKTSRATVMIDTVQRRR